MLAQEALIAIRENQDDGSKHSGEQSQTPIIEARSGLFTVSRFARAPRFEARQIDAMGFGVDGGWSRRNEPARLTSLKPKLLKNDRPKVSLDQQSGLAAVRSDLKKVRGFLLPRKS